LKITRHELGGSGYRLLGEERSVGRLKT
jgi:hypothetical protein